MLKIVYKCSLCFNACKMFSETNVRLISCKQYLSKRSPKVRKLKSEEIYSRQNIVEPSKLIV